jgi:DNA repair photolyase
VGAAGRRIDPALIVTEIRAKSVLSDSKVYDYTVNPYVGCAHACSYCYARFMRRFTGHKEPWGEFVDVKVNAPELLAREIRRKAPGTAWVSGVCDPYQPVEERYELTRQCVQIITEAGWPLVVQTRSALVVRDVDVFAAAPDAQVGLSVTTADDDVRRLFEPLAPPISARVDALARLHEAGVRTFAMVAPLLPGAEGLAGLLAGKVDHVLIDRMNYDYGAWVYRRYHLDDCRTGEFFRTSAERLAADFQRAGVPCRVVF